MEVKNIHNNPEERKFFGKVLGYIVNGLRSLARPKKNTKWDYIVPLSLVGMAFAVHDYAYWNTFDIASVLFSETPERLATKSGLYGLISFELISTFILVIIMIFLTRLQRIIAFILVPLISLPILLAIDMVLGIFEIKLLILTSISVTLFFYFPFLNVGFFLGNISLLVKYGNNSTEKMCITKSHPLRSGIAWAIYGFGIDILYFYAFIFQQAGSNAESTFIFEHFYSAIGIPPLTPLFTILFALIGYIIEKYKGGGKTK